MTPAQHWSSRRPRNRNRTLWGGFIVRASGRQIFFAGDTGYWKHFREVRERFGSVDLALLPIGAYEPRWFMQDQHMNPDDAVRAHVDLTAKLSVATHFGCFQLTDEAIDDPPLELAAARARHGVSSDAFQVLETGETRLFTGQGDSFGSAASSAASSSRISPGPR
jgi:L-ascorbate metabolism protein UlaG (beta-lactamase superfamily)